MILKHVYIDRRNVQVNNVASNVQTRTENHLHILIQPLISELITSSLVYNSLKYSTDNINICK